MSSNKELAERIVSLENTLEQYYFLFLGLKVASKSFEEIIEMAVLEYFEVDRYRFHEEVATRFTDQNLIQSRKWFLSIMHNFLHKNTDTMKKNYKAFYHCKKVQEHRPVYMSAVNNTNADNRKVFLGILAIAKRICDEEGIFEPRLDI